MPKNKKGQYIAKKGKPSGPGHYKAQIKEADSENLDRNLKMEDKYVKEPDEVEGNIAERHPNRNLNKPDIDKPAYS